MPRKPRNQVSVRSTYHHLLSSIQTHLNDGLLAAQRAVEYQRLKTYWLIGRDITRYLEEREGGRDKLNQELYARLSMDIEKKLNLTLTHDTIQRTVQFAKEYTAVPGENTLTFTHYLTLMRVADLKKREQLEKQAIQKNWAVLDLKKTVAQLRRDLYPARVDSGKPLGVERGEPYIYAAIPFKDLAGQDDMAIDCGFKIHVPLSGSIIGRHVRFSAGNFRYIRSVKLKKGYRLTLATRKRQGLHTYAARILKVVDGDTLDALIDVGFGIRVRERFRLKSINAPEISTKNGQAARDFLIDYLSRCPLVIARTEKEGVYGRWLADVFALPGNSDPSIIAAEGQYVNQVLLDKGLAERYR